MKCPICKEGKCGSKYAFGALCDGYSEECKLRNEAEKIVELIVSVRKELMEEYGIKPNGVK